LLISITVRCRIYRWKMLWQKQVRKEVGDLMLTLKEPSKKAVGIACYIVL
jgi:hypothetical protein